MVGNGMIRSRCIDEGRLRAYLDDELGAAEQEGIATHLAGCAACERRLAGLRDTAAAVADLYGAAVAARALGTDPAVEREQAGAALRAFRARLRSEDAAGRRPSGDTTMTVKERMTEMIRRIVTPQRRPVFAALAVLAVFGLVLALSPVESLAGNLAKTFRVQQFSAVTVRVPGMKELPEARELSDAEKAMAVQLLAGLGTAENLPQPGSVREVATEAEAAAHLRQYGGTLRVPRQLPANFAGQAPRYGVSDPAAPRYTLNVSVARQYLAFLNSPELNNLPWPQGVDRLTFALDVPAAVVAAYGDEQRGFGIVQMASPTLSVPDELDVEAVRAALLALPGLPQDTVAQIRNVKDWERTLIIPVPENATTENVKVRGNAGLLILDGEGRGSLLLFEANGVLYGIGGHLSRADVLAVAESMMR